MIPLKDRVVIRQYKAPEKTKTGILLGVDPKAEKPNLGVVAYVGPECKTLKKGHVVVLGTKWFSNCKLLDEELVILCEGDVQGILERDEIKSLGEKLGDDELIEAANG